MHIDELIAHAVATVPYYRSRYRAVPASIERLTPLDRAEIVNNEEAFISDRVDPATLVVSTTTGTTGMPIRLRQAAAERTHAALALWRARRWYGVLSPRQPSCRFYGRREGTSTSAYSFPRISAKGPVLTFNWFDLSDAAFREYHRAMCAHQPVWFQAAPSVLGRFASWLTQHRLAPPASLRLIELAGEVTSPADRAAMREAFPDTAIADSYGSQETWCIAYECPAGALHVQEDNVLVELLDPAVSDDAVTGDIAVTNLHFAAMPLLRYRLSDRVSMARTGCACPRGGPIVREVLGRTVEFATTRTGEDVHPHFFRVVVNQCNADHPQAIRRFQFVQEGLTIRSRIEPGRGWRPEVLPLLERLLERRFTGQVGPVEVGPIEANQGHKFRTFHRTGECP